MPFLTILGRLTPSWRRGREAKNIKILTMAECGVLSSLSSLVVVFSWPVGGLLPWGERPYGACSCPCGGCPCVSKSCECCCCWSIRSWEPACPGPAIVYVGWGLLYEELQPHTNTTVIRIYVLKLRHLLLLNAGEKKTRQRCRGKYETKSKSMTLPHYRRAVYRYTRQEVVPRQFEFWWLWKQVTVITKSGILFSPVTSFNRPVLRLLCSSFTVRRRLLLRPLHITVLILNL